MIGVILISIYSVFCMYFCNLNTRLPVFLNITVIPSPPLLMFYRTRRRMNQNDERNQVKMKLLSYNRLLTSTKRFTVVKERLCRSEAQESKDEASGSPPQRCPFPRRSGLLQQGYPSLQRREHKSKDNSQVL